MTRSRIDVLVVDDQDAVRCGPGASEQGDVRAHRGRLMTGVSRQVATKFAHGSSGSSSVLEGCALIGMSACRSSCTASAIGRPPPPRRARRLAGRARRRRRARPRAWVARPATCSRSPAPSRRRRSTCSRSASRQQSGSSARVVFAVADGELADDDAEPGRRRGRRSPRWPTPPEVVGVADPVRRPGRSRRRATIAFADVGYASRRRRGAREDDRGARSRGREPAEAAGIQVAVRR